MVLAELRKYMTMTGTSQPVEKTPTKLCLSYALNFTVIAISLVAWFYSNLDFVRENDLTLNEAPLQYFMIGTYPIILSEPVYFTFNKQQVSDLIGQFESLVTLRKSTDMSSFQFTLKIS